MSNNNKTPAIRFKGFTDDWEQREFGDLCKIVTKQTGFDYTDTIKGSLLTSPSEDTLPYLQTKNFTGISIDYNTDYFIPKSVAKEFPKINLDEKCLLFSIVGASVGNIGLFPGEKHCFLSGAICVSKLINQNDADYLYHFMCSDNGQIQIHNCTKGGAQATVTIEDIRSFAVLLPTESERSKIGTLLTNIDFLITLHQRKCDKLIQFKAAMLQKMFPQNGADKPEIRFKGFTDAWEQRKFGELVVIERGGSPRPIDDYITDSPDGLNWVKIGDAPEQGNYITSTKEKIKPEGLSKTREVHPGDLILSNSMSFGKPYIMAIDGCIHDGWLSIKNTNNVFDLKFLCVLLGTDQMLTQYKSMAAGSTVNNLNKELIGNTTVTYPNTEEQRTIGQFFEKIESLITLHQRKCEKYKSIKAGLIRKLFP